MIVTGTSSTDGEFGLPVRDLSLSEMGGILDTRVRRRPPSFPPDACQFAVDTAPYYAGSNVTVDQTVNGWIEYLRGEFYSLPEVESVHVTIDDNNVDVWVIIPERDFAVLREVVDREMAVLENLGDVDRPPFLMEFHVLYRCGNAASRLIPQHALSLGR